MSDQDVSLCDLYWRIGWVVYKWTRLPDVEVLKSSPVDDTHFLRVGSIEFWWPREFDSSILPLVWAEVFAGYPPNGHQYLHNGCRLTEGDTVVDAGASEGFFTHLALRQGCRVLAVEPLVRFQVTLRKTFAKDLARENLKVASCALGSRDGWGRLVAPGSELGATLHRESGVQVGAPADAIMDRTAIRTLDRVVEDLGITQVNFIKMDIEGDEPAALLGAKETIRRERPALALACYHYSEEPRQLMDIIQSFDVGYRIVTKGWRRVGTRFVPQILHAWPKEYTRW